MLGENARRQQSAVNWRRAELAICRTNLALLNLEIALFRKYRPDQPRVPAGNPDGGQWTDGGGDGSRTRNVSRPAISERTQLASDITGFKKHGINQAITREIRPSAILDAVTNPLKVRPRANGTTQYIGRDATVVLNPNGEVVTVWPR